MSLTGDFEMDLWVLGGPLFKSGDSAAQTLFTLNIYQYIHFFKTKKKMQYVITCLNIHYRSKV